MSLFEHFYLWLMISVVTVIVVSLIFEKKARISPTPVLPHVRRKAISLIPVDLLETDGQGLAIVDLGCGWGGLIIALARRFPKAQITGYEISPFPYALSKVRAAIRTTLFSPDITITRENFLEHDLSCFDVAFCYLSPLHMADLKPLFEKMKKGSVVISCSFPIEGWEADKTERVRGLFVSIPVYLYVVK